MSDVNSKLTNANLRRKNSENVPMGRNRRHYSSTMKGRTMVCKTRRRSHAMARNLTRHVNKRTSNGQPLEIPNETAFENGWTPLPLKQRDKGKNEPRWTQNFSPKGGPGSSTPSSNCFVWVSKSMTLDRTRKARRPQPTGLNSLQRSIFFSFLPPQDSISLTKNEDN